MCRTRKNLFESRVIIDWYFCKREDLAYRKKDGFEMMNNGCKILILRTKVAGYRDDF